MANPKIGSTFPDVLWVSESFGDVTSAPFDGYTEWESTEEGDVIAEYKLVRVVKVKVKTEKSLVEVEVERGGKS